MHVKDHSRLPRPEVEIIIRTHLGSKISILSTLTSLRNKSNLFVHIIPQTIGSLHT